ncbi:MAG: response regulator [Deltaproteobacteria bacterium]|nr:response regulator [Deltaproteobacteria bacterium]
MPENKILFVEDDLDEDPEDSAGYRLLREAGYDVTIVRSGMEAFRKLQFEAFHLVLLDIMLPPRQPDDEEPLASELVGVLRLNMGLKILELIKEGFFEKARGIPRTVPVVVVSAVPGMERWKIIRSLVGKREWALRKPKETFEVLDAVRQALPLPKKD